MDLKSSSTSWIWSVRDGSALNTNDQAANLQIHSVQGAFKFDLTKASGGNSVNPFQDATATSTAAGGTAPTAAVSGANSGPDANSTSESSGASSDGGNKALIHRTVIAHGIIMPLAFVIFFPLGALTIRLLSMPGTVWVHAGAQVFAYSMAIAGLGLGVWIAVNTQQVQSTIPCLLVRSLPSDDLTTDQRGPSHHRHHRRLPPPPPTLPGPVASLPLRPHLTPHLLGHRARLARPRPHHPRRHQRRPRTAAVGQHTHRRDRLRYRGRLGGDYVRHRGGVGRQEEEEHYGYWDGRREGGEGKSGGRLQS